MSSNVKCINPSNLFTYLSDKNQTDALKRLDKAASNFESNPVLRRFGWNKDGEQFRTRFIEATSKDPSLHVITKADVKSFNLYTKQWTNGLLKGWDGGTIRWKVLQAKLRWLPNGEAVTSKIHNVLSYQRRHGQTNASHIGVIRESIESLSKNFNGVDINYKKLEQLEAKVSSSPDEATKRKYIDDIKTFLGAMESENVRNNAGDLINGIRDVMEGLSPADLMKRDMNTGNAVPWSAKEQQFAQKIQDSWYSVRKDMSKVAVNALRTEIKIAKDMDKMEGGVRGLTKHLEMLQNKIIEIEMSVKKTAEPRKYDYDAVELRGMGLDTKERITLNRELGYMPHHILDIMGHLQEFNNFMHSNTGKSAEQQFKEVVDWYGARGNRPERLKSRADGNQGYYSRNPLFFLQKYVHDIAKYNHDTQMKDILRETFDTLLRTKDFANGGGSVDTEVNSIVDSGIMMLKGVAESSWIGGAKAGDTISNKNPNGNWLSKAVRGLTAFTFSRTMGLGIRSGGRNYVGGRLLNYIEHGKGMRKAAKNYITNSDIEGSMTRELERYGLYWEKGGFLDQITSEYNKAAVGRGSLEEGTLPPGLKEMIAKDGKRVIVVADPTLFDKALNTIETTATGAGIIHKHIENLLRPGVFKEVYAVTHENLMSRPQHWLEAQIGTTRQSLGDVKWLDARRRWVDKEAGRLAYESVIATQFDYSAVNKADVLNTNLGKVFGQYQHYRFSLANYMKRTVDDGFRQLRAGNINSLETQKLARLGLAYPVIEMGSWLTGLGFAGLAKNDIYEFVKNVYNILTLDATDPEGQEKLAKSTHGLGAASLLGPNVSLALEIGRVTGLMHENPTNKFISLSMIEGQPKTESDFDRNMRIARLGNIEIARWGGYVLPSLSRLEWWKAIRTQFGLWTTYEDQKSARQITEPALRPVRDIFGITQPKWSDSMYNIKSKKPAKKEDYRARALKSIQNF